MVIEILSELSRRGVVTRADGETIRLRPKSALDEALLVRVREYKSEILAALSARPATCAASCYQIEPGRWVHHPWDGCRTVPASQPVQSVLQAECRHCDGAGMCDCPACTLRRTEDAVPCCMCRPQERQKWLATTVQTRCWHCRGTKVCSCILCWDPGTDAAGQCTFCHGSGMTCGRVN